MWSIAINPNLELLADEMLSFTNILRWISFRVDEEVESAYPTLLVNSI